MPKMTIAEAKEVDMVDYLAMLGHQPTRITGPDHWYRSPFREEKTASFKVNRKLNLWYDHGIGKGGDIIDFGTQYFNTTVSEFLSRLSERRNIPTFAPSEPATAARLKPDLEESKIDIRAVRPLTSDTLISYLAQRGIPFDIANKSVKEVDFKLYKRQHTAIGFPNNSGGFELRNAYFKGSSAPKDITYIDRQAPLLTITEGFTDYLSFLTLEKDRDSSPNNFLILNSLAFLERSRPLIDQYKKAQFLFDHDPAGKKATRTALSWNPAYSDGSKFYLPHKDLNEWLMRQQQGQDKSHCMGKRL